MNDIHKSVISSLVPFSLKRKTQDNIKEGCKKGKQLVSFACFTLQVYSPYSAVNPHLVNPIFTGPITARDVDVSALFISSSFCSLNFPRECITIGRERERKW